MGRFSVVRSVVLLSTAVTFLVTCRSAGPMLNDAGPAADRVSATPPPGVINVADFGANGDASTDDTAAINRARDVAGIGGSVLFPAGRTFKATVLLPLEGQTWYGAGAHLLSEVDIYRDHVTLRGFEIGPVAGYGVYFTRVSGTRLLDLYVHDTADVGIFGETGVVDSVIDGCTVVRSSAGGVSIHAQASSPSPGARNRITNTTVRASGPISIEVWSPGSSVQHNQTEGGDIGISVGGAPGSEVALNIVRSARSYGIELGAGYGSLVHENVVEDTKGPAGIILDDAEHDSKVLRNAVRHSAQRAIQLSLGSKTNTIDSNVIEGYGLLGIETHGADGNIVTNNGRPLVVRL